MSSIMLLLLLVILTTIIVPTHGGFITTINTQALRSLIRDVRDQVLPNFVDIINSVADETLSISTQVGSCCGRGETGAKATVSLSNLQINNQTLNDPIMATKSSSSSSSSSSNEIATLTFQTRNIDLQTKITSSIAVSLGLGGSGINCNPSLRVFMKMPQLSFNVNLVRGGSSSSSTDVGVSSYQASMNGLQIDPIELYITVVDDSTGLCDNVLQPITNVLNQAASLLSQRATTTFQTEISNYMSNYLFDTIPIAFDLPIPMTNGNLDIGLGIQSLQSTSNGILSVLGTSFTSTITEVEWRNQYYYNRALTDTASVTTDVTTASSLLNNNDDDKLIQMQITYPPFNNFIAAIWYLIWPTLANDPTVLNHMEDFCTIPDTNTTTTTSEPILDPCPFPPIRSTPFSIFDTLLLRVFFMGNTNFQYQTVIEPPIMDILSSTTDTPSLSDIVLQGRGRSKVVLRGTESGGFGLFQSLLGSGSASTSGERTIASLDVDIVVDMNLPNYNRDTGIIEWDDNGFSIRIENAVSATRFPLFGNAFTNLATKFINQFIAQRLLTPINNGIRLGLEQLPIKIPSLRNLPLRNANIDFTFPNFNMNFQSSEGMTIVSDLSIDVAYPSAIMSSDETEDTANEVDTITTTIVALAQDVFTETTDDTIIVFTTINGEDTVTSRVTNNNDNTVTVENNDNGDWVNVPV